MKKFLFIVCNNGFGHIKRVASVIEKLYTFSDKIESTIVSGSIQKDYLIQNSLVKRFGLNVVTKPFESVGSPNEKYENAFKWLDYLPDDLLQDRKIISDNYPCILNRSEAILMGSFLWSDVYRNHYDVETRNLVSKETEILKQNRPEMLCNKYFYMKNLDEILRPVKLPFFCDEFSGRYNRYEDRNSVLITLGGGVADRNEIDKLISYFVRHKIIVYLDKILFNLYHDRFNDSQVRLFGFSSTDFSRLRLIIGRPGIGLITDSCQSGVPIVALCLDENPEILHNGNVISYIGMGRFSTDIYESMEMGLTIYSEKGTWNSFHQNIVLMEMNGHAKAAEYLLEI